MRAAVWHGGKDIRIEDVPKPRAGRGEALIRVKAVGICGSELHAYEGLSKRRTPPLVMGHEFAGVVEEIGEGPARIAIGDRVVANPLVPCGVCGHCLSGRIDTCAARRHVGVDFPGAFAQYVKMPSRVCYQIPDSVSFEDATLTEPLSIATHTVNVAHVNDGDAVLILGSGVIGLSCLIVARERARMIVVTDLVDFRLNFARLLGADTVINTSTVDPVSEVQRINSGKGADVIIEAVGLEKTISQAISSANDAGRVVLVGMLEETALVNVLRIVLKQIHVIGSYGRTESDFVRALTLLEGRTSKVHQLITHTFSLDDISEAFEIMATQKQSTMKIVVLP